jgi:hypothetical protein
MTSTSAILYSQHDKHPVLTAADAVFTAAFFAALSAAVPSPSVLFAAVPFAAVLVSFLQLLPEPGPDPLSHDWA